MHRGLATTMGGVGGGGGGGGGGGVKTAVIGHALLFVFGSCHFVFGSYRLVFGWCHHVTVRVR